MTKAELGIKRLCPNCGAKYYDLNKVPILCPRCGTQFEVTSVKARAQARQAEPADDEAETEDAPAAEFVSLEEADEEATESGAVKVDVDDDEEVETDDDDDDDTFLADDEEEDDDVTDIIGDVEDDET